MKTIFILLIKNQIILWKIRLFIILCLFVHVTTGKSQSTYYGLTNATNPNDPNNWTMDPTGNSLLLPPSSFSNVQDTFIINGNNMTVTSDWIVAGTIQVLHGYLYDFNYKFSAKSLYIGSGTSELFMFNSGDIHIGKLLIGSNACVNTGVSSGSDTTGGLQIDDSLIIKGSLWNSNPIYGTGNFNLCPGATLELQNGGIYQSGNNGLIAVSGTRFFSKAANYIFDGSDGNYSTGPGLPDTVANLAMNTSGEAIDTLSSSTTVTGTFSSTGVAGAQNNNTYVSLGSSVLNCKGSISLSGGVSIIGSTHSAFIISGKDTSSFKLVPIKVDSIVIDINNTISLNGNMVAISNLNLINGIVQTTDFNVQLGISSEGSFYYTNGWVEGNFISFKNSVNTNPIIFPVGTSLKPDYLTITYSTPPTLNGLISVACVAGNGLNSLLNPLIDGVDTINYYSNFYWKITSILVSGGTFSVSSSINNIVSPENDSLATFLFNESGTDQYNAFGNRLYVSKTFIQRNNVPGIDLSGNLYIGIYITNSSQLPTLSVSAKTIQISADSTSDLSFTIHSNIDWNIKNEHSWLNTNQTEGNDSATIDISVTTNSLLVPRIDTLFISGVGVNTDTLIVIQEAGNPTGIEEAFNSNISIFPVPVVDQLNISFANLPNHPHFELFNTTGICIYSFDIKNSLIIIDMSRFASGIYLAKITSDKKTLLTKQIIKQ